MAAAAQHLFAVLVDVHLRLAEAVVGAAQIGAHELLVDLRRHVHRRAALHGLELDRPANRGRYRGGGGSRRVGLCGLGEAKVAQLELLVLLAESREHQVGRLDVEMVQLEAVQVRHAHDELQRQQQQVRNLFLLALGLQGGQRRLVQVLALDELGEEDEVARENLDVDQIHDAWVRRYPRPGRRLDDDRRQAARLVLLEHLHSHKEVRARPVGRERLAQRSLPLQQGALVVVVEIHFGLCRRELHLDSMHAPKRATPQLVDCGAHGLLLKAGKLGARSIQVHGRLPLLVQLHHLQLIQLLVQVEQTRSEVVGRVVLERRHGLENDSAGKAPAPQQEKEPTGAPHEVRHLP